MNPIIIIDLDDTLNFFANKWLNVVYKEHGVNLAFESIDKWNGVSYRLAEAKGWTFKEAHDYCMSLFHRDGFFLDVHPDRAGLRVVHQLYDCGFEIVIASKPPFDYSVKKSYAHLDKMKWVKKHFPHIYKNIPVVLTANKNYIRGDILIDDSTANVIASKGIHTTIALDKPWNQDAEPNYRCKNWLEILDVIKQLYPMNFEDTFVSSSFQKVGHHIEQE